MRSTRPYLIRAIYEWAQDSAFTPHILVDATADSIVVPEQFVEDGQIVLNVAANAVANLNLGDDFISFSARFAGVAQEIFVPVVAVRAIYARENGVGLVLPDETAVADGEDQPPPTPPDRGGPPTKGGGSHLKVVK